MSNTLEKGDPNKRVVVTDVVKIGDKLIVPEAMEYPEAIELIKRRMLYENQIVTLNDTFDVFPWDGANALAKVLTDIYGWAPAVNSGRWGTTPPAMITVEVGYQQHKQVPWGKFELPGVEGHIACDTANQHGRMCFALTGMVKRRDEPAVQRIFNLVRAELAVNSLYRGKAFKLRFRDDNGKVLHMPEPSFLNTDDVDESLLVYPPDVEAAIQTNLFTPITRVGDCLRNKVPVKRGVLLGGTYGTGKTLAAKVASKLAVQSGVTYIYVPRADELADAVAFSKQYQSPACVIFCEDIDRVLSGERTVAVDDVLNIIDGIDSKSSNVIVVLTTNDLSAVTPAMLRPGRLDAVIEVTAPDAKGIERLIRAYGGDTIPASASLERVGAELAGTIPAVVAEVVKRAKLAQIKLAAPGEIVTEVTEDALIEAARTMKMQLNLLNRPRETRTPADELSSALEKMVQGAIGGLGIDRQVEKILAHVS